MTTTKLRSDAFVQATGDFDGNLCISLSYCRDLVMVRAGVIKLDIFSPDWGMLRRSMRVLIFL